jgi:hypothetical protein
MKTIDKTMAIFVLTGRGIGTMLAEGGSQAWKINAKRAKECEYVVCIQNHNQDYFEPEQLSAQHHHAFLVGKLATISTADPASDKYKNRKKLVFSHYALIDLPNSWPAHRNPVFYDYLESMGIDLEALNFQPMPVLKPSVQEADKTLPLTITQAKAGLALNFNITPGDIEIVIRV